MSQNVSRYLVPALAAVFAVAGCASKTPLEQALESRAAYKASLNSFFVKQTPLVEEAPLDDAESMDGNADADAPSMPAEGDEGEEMMEVEVPTRQDAVLDIIVQHDTARPLAGLTLDITMVDAERNEVGHWQMWAETEGLPKANQRTFTHVLEGVEYQEGFGFNVEVRAAVPAAEYGDYPELSGL